MAGYSYLTTKYLGTNMSLGLALASVLYYEVRNNLTER